MDFDKILEKLRENKSAAIAVGVVLLLALLVTCSGEVVDPAVLP